jgi:dolichol-phosphate mannosyltransferase
VERYLKVKDNPHISVVIPVYGCREALFELYGRLVDSLEKINPLFEIIMVNDDCPQNSWEVIKEIASKDNRLKGINLSKNFGQHYAITAGIDHAKGDWVVVMDCDLQDQPEEIIKLYSKTMEGYDIVVGKRVDRKDGFMKKFFSKLMWKVLTYLADIKLKDVDSRIGNFGIYSRTVISSIVKMREQNRSFGAFAIWVGFKRAEIDIQHAKRGAGKSSYSFIKQVRLATDTIVAYSNKLLKFSVKLGFLMTGLSFLCGLWMIISYFIWSIPVTGWTSLIVSLYFLSGLIMGSIGIAGLYIGKIFDEVKGRPLYVIKETTGNVDL